MIVFPLPVGALNTMDFAVSSFLFNIFIVAHSISFTAIF